MKRSLPAVCALLLLACNDDGSAALRDGGPDATQCGGAGDGACPVLDDCPDNHVPVPGGGCKRVGVEQCQVDDGPGLLGPPDWTCKAIGPPRKSCLPGWTVHKGHTWCEPVLPSRPCADGTMEVLGQAACQPVGACGSGTWGNIPLVSTTLFVDASYQGADADGSQARPYPSIGEALKAAAPGAHIAVAAGDYQENLVLSQWLVLEGRCPAKVRLTGQDDSAAAITVQGTVTLRGLSVSGPGVGVRIESGKAAVEQVDVASCGEVGVEVVAPGELMLRDSLVTGNRFAGIGVQGATAEVERSVVRDTQPLDGKNGLGILAVPTGGQGASLTVRDSLVSGNSGVGIYTSGTTTVVERSVVRDTRTTTACGSSFGCKDDIWGWGVQVQRSDKQPASLLMRDSIVAENHTRGVSIGGCTAKVERSVVRGTKPQTADNRGGDGLWVDALYGKPAQLVLRDSAVVGNRRTGVWGTDAKVEVERSVVRDTLPQASDGYMGKGIDIGSNQSAGTAALQLKDSIVRHNRFIGVGVFGADATIQRTVVAHTQPGFMSGLRDGSVGTGINVSGVDRAGKLVIQDALVTDNHYLGVAIFDTPSAAVSRSIVRDTRANAAGSDGSGVWAGAPHRRTGLTLTDSLIANNRVAGLLVASASVTAQRCRVKNTLTGKDVVVPSGSTRPVTWEGFGDGVLVTNHVGSPFTGALELTDSLVEDSARAGVLIESASGAVRRSVLRRGTCAVALDQGKAELVNNLFEDNTENRVTFAAGLARPAPPYVPSSSK